MTLDVTIITGMSGAGRSAAADVLEDLGFFVIDNLPPALIAQGRRAGAGRRGPAAATRSSSTCAPASSSTTSAPRWPSSGQMGASTRVLFLDAADDVLVRRYEATRRKHPLAADERVSEGIAQRAGSCSRS